MCLRNRSHRINDPEGAFLVYRREIERRTTRALGSPDVARELAAQKPAGERTPRQDCKLLIVGERHDLTLEIAPGDAVVGLHALEAFEAALVGNPECFRNLPRGQVAQADIANLARPYTVVERTQGLF